MLRSMGVHCAHAERSCVDAATVERQIAVCRKWTLSQVENAQYALRASFTLDLGGLFGDDEEKASEKSKESKSSSSVPVVVHQPKPQWKYDAELCSLPIRTPLWFANCQNAPSFPERFGVASLPRYFMRFSSSAPWTRTS